jgi:phosphohistidine phosphatase
VKQLILFRHAKSSWSDSSQPDIERPLSERGERDAPRMGGRLRARQARPELLLTSPAIRAARTAHLLARSMGYSRELIRSQESLYLATPDEILDVIAAQDNDVDCLLVIGHNPGLTELTNRLLPDLALDNLPTSGAVAIVCGAASVWAAFRTAACRLSYYDYPKNPELFVTEN